MYRPKLRRNRILKIKFTRKYEILCNEVDSGNNNQKVHNIRKTVTVPVN